MTDAPIYFSFPDGSLDYACAACDALCCRGNGFGGRLSREMGALLEAYPALSLGLVERAGDYVTAINPPGGCYFLREDRRCGVEVTHGKAAKPAVCTLFPFSRVLRLGEAWVIAPHLLCPLRVEAPARPGAVEGTHARLRDELLRTGMLEVLQPAPLLPKKTSKARAAEAVAREFAFRDDCGAALGRGVFRSFVEARAEGAGSQEFAARASLLLGGVSAPPLARDAVDDLFFALGPTLRLTMPSATERERLRALALWEVLARRLLALLGRAPGARELWRVVESTGPMVRLLAGEAPLSGPPKKVPALGDPVSTFAAFQFSREVARYAPLEAAERGLARVPVAERSVLLLRLGSERGA